MVAHWRRRKDLGTSELMHLGKHKLAHRRNLFHEISPLDVLIRDEDICIIILYNVTHRTVL